MEPIAVKKYNHDHEREFGEKRAIRKFLDPIGLSIYDSPSVDFQNYKEKLSADAERRHFEALHFIKYRLSRSSGSLQNRWKGLHIALRNRLASSNLGLVHKCCKLTTVSIERDTLISLGYMSLISCVDNFDPWRNIRFSTYACNGILRNFLNQIRNKPTASVLDDYAEDVQTMDNPDKHSEVYLDRLTVAWVHNLGDMTKTEYDVLRQRFGLSLTENFERAEPATLAAIGKQYQLTRERIRQIESVALKKLRQVLENDPILA